MPAIPGQRLSHFLLLEKLGEGGMGVVYKARDERLNRLVALKVLPPRLTDNPERRRRLLHEARAAASINHPNVATIYEVDEAEGLVFYAMEMVEGKTLRTVLTLGRLSLGEALRIGADLAAGVARAHQASVIHRDLKPENIVLSADGLVKILDFGLARTVSDAAESGDNVAGDSPTESMRAEGVITGTTSYMSPEQARGQVVDHRSDIFSLGIVLYELITGTNPFYKGAGMDTLAAVVGAAPPPASKLNAEVPAELDRILAKCLEKEPVERYQNAADLAVDLRHLRRDSGTTRAVAVPAPARPWARPVFAGAAGLAILAAGYLVARIFGFGFGAAPAKADENTLAVAAFGNLKDPSDPERLGQILQELVITDLSELGSLNVLSSQRLHDVERQVRRGRSDQGGDLALRVASRAGARRLLTGTLSALGGSWVLTGQLIDVAQGTVISSARVNGADLYAMVDELTARIRTDLRVRQPDLAAMGTPVREKTSASLEAQRAYVEGVDRFNALDYRGAADRFRAAIAIDSTFGQAYYKLSLASWWAHDDIEDALEPLQRLLSRGIYATEKDRLMAEGALALISPCFQSAKATFERVVATYPDEKEAWYGLGEASFHGPGDFPSAREAFRRAIALDPAFSLPYIHILDMDRMEGKLAEARADLDRLTATDPNNPRPWRWRVWLEIGNRDSVAIRAVMDSAMKRLTKPADRRELFLGTGRAYFMNQKPPNRRLAREYLMRALASDPRTQATEVYASLAALEGEENHQRDAEKWILKGLAAAPNDPDLADRYYRTLSPQGRFREIITRAKSTIQRDPDGATIWFMWWAAAAIAAGDSAETARAVPAALARHPERYSQRRIAIQIAWDFRNANQLERAEDLCRKAIDAVPDCEDAEPYNLLGWILQNRWNFSAAESVFQKGLTLGPRHQGLQNGLLTAKVSQGKYRETIEAAKRFVREIPAELANSAYLNWVRAAAYLGDRAEVDSAFAAAERAPGAPDRSAMATAASDASYVTGDVIRSAEMARRIPREANGETPAYASMLLGRAHFRVGDLRPAEALARSAFARDPNSDPAANLLLSILMYQPGHSPEALEIAKAWAKRAPLSDNAPAWLALVHRRAGRRAEAERAIAEALRLRPSVEGKRRFLAFLAMFNALYGDQDGCAVYVRGARSLGTTTGDALLQTASAWLLIREGRAPEAERSIQGQTATPLWNAYAKTCLPLAQIETGRLDAAERTLRAQLSRGPVTSYAHSMLGAVMAARGGAKDALPSAERAAAMDSGRVNQALLAYVLATGGGDLARAERLARRAIAKGVYFGENFWRSSAQPSPEEAMGMVLLKRGDVKGAIRYLEAAARGRPDRPAIRTELEEARKLLAS